MRKKAITPLISTVLLIVFAIGLGALVMSWGNSSNLALEPQHVDLAITKLDDKSQICTDGDSIDAVLENNGNTDITGIDLVILTPDSVINRNSETYINQGDYKRTVFEDIGSVDILKLRFIPITKEGQQVDKKIEIEHVGECT